MSIEKYILLNIIRNNTCVYSQGAFKCTMGFITGNKLTYNYEYRCPLYAKVCHPMVAESGNIYMMKPDNFRQVAAKFFITFYGTESELFDECL